MRSGVPVIFSTKLDKDRYSKEEVEELLRRRTMWVLSEVNKGRTPAFNRWFAYELLRDYGLLICLALGVGVMSVLLKMGGM